jgi:aspartate/methionine/tyrosine aminotransferase
MVQISRRANLLPASATSGLREAVKRRRAAGEDVIALDAGELDFATPEHIVEAAARAAREPALHHYSPTAGLPALRDAISAEAASRGRIVDPDAVVVSAGAKQAAFNAILSLVDPGDEVLLPAPYWVSYPAMIALAGGSVKTVPTVVEGNFGIGIDQLEAAASPRTKLLVIVNPGNPTGAVASAQELAAIAEWVRERPVWLLLDEIYRHLTYDGAFVSLLEVAPDLADRTVVVDGVSKCYAMTGWRVGWLTGAEEVIRAAIRLQSHSSSHTSNVAQAAALAALTGPQDVLRRFVAVLNRRRRRFFDAVSQLPNLVCAQPRGALYAFPNVSDALASGVPVRGTDADLALELLDRYGTSVVPGTVFGAPGHLRLSYALSEESLAEGMRRLALAFGSG